jgi:hypothetical protein
MILISKEKSLSPIEATIECKYAIDCSGGLFSCLSKRRMRSFQYSWLDWVDSQLRYLCQSGVGPVPVALNSKQT